MGLRSPPLLNKCRHQLRRALYRKERRDWYFHVYKPRAQRQKEQALLQDLFLHLLHKMDDQQPDDDDTPLSTPCTEDWPLTTTLEEPLPAYRHPPSYPAAAALPATPHPASSSVDPPRRMATTASMTAPFSSDPDDEGFIAEQPQNSGPSIPFPSPDEAARRTVARDGYLLETDLRDVAYAPFALLLARLNSYKEPGAAELLELVGMSAEELSWLGFYYPAGSTSLRCFYCGSGLRGWSADNTPYNVAELHTEYAPNCAWLNRVQGKAWVDAVLVRKGLTRESASAAVQALSRARRERDAAAPRPAAPAAPRELELPTELPVGIRVSLEEVWEQTTLSTPLLLHWTPGLKLSQCHLTLGEPFFNKTPPLDLVPPALICILCKKSLVQRILGPCSHLLTCFKCTQTIKHCPDQGCKTYIDKHALVHVQLCGKNAYPEIFNDKK